MAQGDISEAELAAFADGSVSRRRRAPVAACVERSPESDVRLGAQRIAYSIIAGHACGIRQSRDERLEPAAWNGSMDIAPTRPSAPLHRLAA